MREYWPMRLLTFSVVLVASGTDPATTTFVPPSGNPEEVKSFADTPAITDGDAVGNAWSGEYDLKVYTKACEGQCSFSVAQFPVGVCDVGTTDNGSGMVTQTNGHLSVEQ